MLIWSIKLYQKTLSFDHGPMRGLYPNGYCRYYPSCSQYAIDALTKYGVLTGSWRAIKRVLACNPWSAGGIDPVC